MAIARTTTALMFLLLRTTANPGKPLSPIYPLVSPPAWFANTRATRIFYFWELSLALMFRLIVARVGLGYREISQWCALMIFKFIRAIMLWCWQRTGARFGCLTISVRSNAPRTAY